jgi:5-methylthioribose kinase
MLESHGAGEVDLMVSVDRQDAFRRDHPDVVLLRASEPDRVRGYLVGRGVVDADDGPVVVATAGEGNMNCTLRVVTPLGRLIVKQARPWVEKYDHIPAPWNRSHVEAAFYASVAGIPGVGDRMPRLIHADPVARVLVLEDLGTGGDLTSMYSGGRLSDDECEMLADYLVRLHRVDVAADRAAVLSNRDMRTLNHEHIFRVPLVEANGLALDKLTPGLQDLADELKRDSVFVAQVQALGVRYLEDGATLVHGDYFPGSWVRTNAGIAVIDPEFCFLGCREFDLGVMIAHLTLAGATAAHLDTVERAIARGRGDTALAHQFAGVEIMRRLIGVAQLPFAATFDRKQELLVLARQLLLAS